MDGSTSIEETKSLPTVRESNSTSIMNIVAEAARNPAFDIARLEKLISLQTDLLARDAKMSFARDFAEMKPSLPKIIRTKINTHTKSKYADLSEINEIIDPILGKYGFATSAELVSQKDDSVTVLVELNHRDGHTKSTELTFPIDNKGAAGTVNKTVIQGITSTISYIKRVGTCLLCNISTGDDIDGNHISNSQTIDTEQAATIDNLIRETKSDREAVLKYAQANDVRNILVSNYKKVLIALENTKKAMKK